MISQQRVATRLFLKIKPWICICKFATLLRHFFLFWYNNGIPAMLNFDGNFQYPSLIHATHCFSLTLVVPRINWNLWRNWNRELFRSSVGSLADETFIQTILLLRNYGCCWMSFLSLWFALQFNLETMHLSINDKYIRSFTITNSSQKCHNNKANSL